MLAANSPGPDPAPENAVHLPIGGGDRADLAQQIARLRDENAALKSVLCGLCIGISQISEVHRAIVAQTFDYADRFAQSGELGGIGDAPTDQTRTQVIDQMRALVLNRQAELGRRY